MENRRRRKQDGFDRDNKKSRAMKPCLCENQWQSMFLDEQLAPQRLQTEQRAAQEGNRHAGIGNNTYSGSPVNIRIAPAEACREVAIAVEVGDITIVLVSR